MTARAKTLPIYTKLALLGSLDEGSATRADKDQESAESAVYWDAGNEVYRSFECGWEVTKVPCCNNEFEYDSDEFRLCPDFL
ncbi:hypothetical protein NEOLEDRAFT_1128902 [Neolentinus lepideus HHB14362 ss-1]|uniref:Uncharacterized protein n=1 Tax=Neolentinus lepideus HHB14362 ss-1 TaxID=1314782 RepID=A0A165UUG2_9AGAM|nr:hypothetical protein NEOLEDRAFT_1128902 [Neolentinus lepideus HHB14362 ss-1]